VNSLLLVGVGLPRKVNKATAVGRLQYPGQEERWELQTDPDGFLPLP